MITNKEDLILDFIEQFRNFNTEDCFSNGMCYWFAHILKTRFADEHTHIMYDEIINHFACQINDRIYDITGDVTDAEYDWRPFMRITDPLLMRRIYRDCIDKISNDVITCNYCEFAYMDDLCNLACPFDLLPRTFNDVCNHQEKGIIK